MKPLSRRELQILQLMADGKGNQEIAEQLDLTIRTCESYSHHLMLKLQASNRAHAVAEGFRKGLIQ